MINVTYERTENHLVAMQLQYVKEKCGYYKRWIRMLIVFLVPCLFVAALMTMVAIRFTMPRLSLFAFLIALLGVLTIANYPLLTRQRVIAHVKEVLQADGGDAHIGKVQLVLSDTALMETCGGKLRVTQWTNVFQILETKAGAFLQGDCNTGWMVWPRPSFRSSDEYQQVVDFAIERVAHFHGHA